MVVNTRQSTSEGEIWQCRANSRLYSAHHVKLHFDWCNCKV